MIGLWFAINGLFLGTLCSLKAKSKNRYTHDWFLLGFVFGIFAYIFLLILPNADKAKVTGDYEFDRINFL